MCGTRRFRVGKNKRRPTSYQDGVVLEVLVRRPQTTGKVCFVRGSSCLQSIKECRRSSRNAVFAVKVCVFLIIVFKLWQSEALRRGSASLWPMLEPILGTDAKQLFSISFCYPSIRTLMLYFFSVILLFIIAVVVHLRRHRREMCGVESRAQVWAILTSTPGQLLVAHCLRWHTICKYSHHRFSNCRFNYIYLTWLLCLTIAFFLL